MTCFVRISIAGEFYEELQFELDRVLVQMNAETTFYFLWVHVPASFLKIAKKPYLAEFINWRLFSNIVNFSTIILFSLTIFI